ncbi:MAG: TonB-dependent receptor [Arcobacteraceae bacterium]|nr:TonB-dependent receptor [Arcobacteraceae bacterium]MDY0326624.1 TonB-dependent receptor [Arcobacteraceae bacterium]
MTQKISISLVASLIIATYSQANTQNIGTIEVVSATKSNQSIKDVTSNVEIITGEELEEKHIKTVLDALKSRGISTTQSGGIGQQSSLFLRGFSSGNTLVLIDGISYNDPTTTEGQANLEHLMISDIERIEIIKGAQSGIWGANAVAGVINIITKKASQELHTNANIEFGSNNTKNYQFSISQKVDKFSYYLGANYTSTDGISARTPYNINPKNYEDDGYKNKTINAKIGYDINDNNQIGFNITDIDAKTEFDRNNPDDNQDELTQKNRLYGINYIFNTDKYDITAKYEKTKFKKEDPTAPMFWTPEFEGTIDKYILNSKINYLQDSFVLIGADKQISKDKINDNTIENKGLFVTNSNQFGNLILSESLRNDRFDKFQNKTTGKIGAKYFINDDVNLSANYGTAYKAPALYELYDGFSGNINLKPSEVKSKDISMEYKNLKLTYFTNKITNEILYSSTLWSYYNENGTSRIKGYEVSFNSEIYENLLFGTNYIKYDAKDKDGYQLAKRPKYVLGASLDYYGISSLHLGINAKHIGKRVEYTWGTHNISEQTGKYTLIDTVVNYDITKNLKTYLKIDNITDRRYQETAGYATYGRVYKVGLNAKF